MSGRFIEIPWGSEKVVYTDTFGDREMFLGQRGMTPDGRTFRWCFSAGAIPAGNGVQTGPTVATAQDDLVVGVHAVDSTTIDVTTEAAIAANLYEDGYVYIHITPGVGYMYVIRDHLATTGAAVMTLNLHDKVVVALTATSRAGLMQNPYKDVIEQTAGGNVGAFLGVAPSVVTDNDYFWVQDSGIVNALHEDLAAVLGDAVELGENVAGAVQLHDVSGETNRAPVGIECNVATPAGEHGLILLKGLF